jgi:hypothetical protein
VEPPRAQTILQRYPLSLTLPATLLFLASCAQTNALIGDHQNAAFSYRSSAQATEKQAKKEADLQNHLVAAQKYIEAAKSRISSAQEYQSLGNPVWTKNMFDKASTDLSSAANEIRSAGESEVH